MTITITCKTEEDPTKREGAEAVTPLYFDIPDDQGQLTPY